uniref:Retinoic acid receptor responder protein 2 n=1 Tax=Cynoglossus semilaevis TaxID=244447 RepID=A0A3P8WUF1_CYNSE
MASPTGHHPTLLLLLPLLLLCAGAVLSSADTREAYDLLPDNQKPGVDLALQQLNVHAGVHHHFRFLRSVYKSDMESGFGVSYIYHHFYLKPTRCPKGSTNTSPQQCPFRNDRPLMDCGVCYKTVQDQMEAVPKPYVNCIQKPRLTEEMKANRLDHCKKMAYNSGAPTLLSVSSGSSG